MLAQSFKSAADLGITEPQRDALIKTLVLLETGKLVRQPLDRVVGDVERQDRKFSGLFNMDRWAGGHPCGTVGCIGGTAEMIGNVQFGTDYCRGIANAELRELFLPDDIHINRWKDITPTQAATALRSYLNCGDAKWSEACA